MGTDISRFVVPDVDATEVDRLAAIYTDGDRDALLREAIRIMAAQERAERLQRLQARIHTSIGESGSQA